MQGDHHAASGEERTAAAGERDRRERGEAAPLVCKAELGPAAAHPAAGECVPAGRARADALQIVPATSNGADAVNFRHLRESGSLDFERQTVGSVPGTPGGGGDDGMESAGEDLFGAFSSVTLKHDGE